MIPMWVRGCTDFSPPRWDSKKTSGTQPTQPNALGFLLVVVVGCVPCATFAARWMYCVQTCTMTPVSFINAPYTQQEEEEEEEDLHHQHGTFQERENPHVLLTAVVVISFSWSTSRNVANDRGLGNHLHSVQVENEAGVDRWPKSFLEKKQ